MGLSVKIYTLDAFSLFDKLSRIVLATARMKNRHFPRRLLLVFGGLFFPVLVAIEAKKPKNTPDKAPNREASSASVANGEENNKREFQLKSLEVVEPAFFTETIESENADETTKNLRNSTFRDLPHYRDNEFEAKRKKNTLRDKWVGRQFLIVMGPNDYKESREIIKSLEPDVYTNAEILEAYDFKKKVFPLKVWLSCIDIGTDRQESGSYESFGERKFAFTYVTHQICLNNLLGLDMAFEKNRYPDYFISIPEKEAEALKADFENTQMGIVVAWLPDDTGEVKGETVDWGKFEYNGQLGSETFDRLELKWTAIEIFIRHGDKIYQSKLAPNRKSRFTLAGHDLAKTRQKFKEATDKAVQKVTE